VGGLKLVRYQSDDVYTQKQQGLCMRRSLLVEEGGVLKGPVSEEFRKELRALLINGRSIFTQLTLSKPLLSFNFAALVLVSLTLTPAFMYAQTPPRLNLNSTWIMASSSMSPNLHQNDGLIVDSHVPFNSLKIGDIIVSKTYYPNPDTGQHEIIVHRVAQIVTDPSNGQRIIRTKGDANPSSIPQLDYPIFQQNYIGKVVYVIPQLGAVLGAGKNSTTSGGNTGRQ
jgi:signal peptidase I